MDKILNSKFKKILAFFFFYYISNILLWYIFDRNFTNNAIIKYGLDNEIDKVNILDPITNLGYSITFQYYWLKSGCISIVIMYLILRKK